MSQYGKYPLQRTDMRKKKKMNRMLNVSIGIVALLIVFIGGMLILGGDSDEAVLSDEMEENESNNDNNGMNTNDAEGEENNSDNISVDENTSTSDNDQENNSSEPEMNESNNNENEDMNESNNENEDMNDSNNEGEESLDSEDGEWDPIGTSQGESFSPDYGDGTVNREEMDRALSYATGLSSEEMTVWRVENGGDQKTVVGTVSTSENKNQPYKVIISWVENEGWMPVSVERLSSNPYN